MNPQPQQWDKKGRNRRKTRKIYFYLKKNKKKLKHNDTSIHLSSVDLNLVVYPKLRGSTVAMLPHNKKVWVLVPYTNSMNCWCPPHACMGSLRVFWFPSLAWNGPSQPHAHWEWQSEATNSRVAKAKFPRESSKECPTVLSYCYQQAAL